MWSFFLWQVDPLCPRALMAIHGKLRQWVQPTGDGDGRRWRGGGDPTAFFVVVAPRVVVSAPVIVVIAHRVALLHRGGFDNFILFFVKNAPDEPRLNRVELRD